VPTGPLTSASLAVSANSAGTIAASFAGLSYEKGSISSPRFTSASTQLIGVHQLLGKSLLRIGGNTVDATVWVPNGKGQTQGQVAPPDIDALAGFLKATGWQCLYGVNLGGSANGTTTPALAAAEVAYVSQQLGSMLYGIEIGNECDLYGSPTATDGFYAPSFPLSAFETLWGSFRSAIVASTPGVSVTGPASANNESSWTVPFGEYETRNKLSLLTQHYYRGTGTSPAATSAGLVAADPTLVSYLGVLQAGAQTIGIPFRMSECNSYSSGSSSGVCDGFGSALWALDFLFDCALGGSVGVNFHTLSGGAGSYTPILGTNGSVTGLNPEYYAMVFFNLAGSGTLYQTTLNAAGLNVTAYAVKTAAGALNVILVNKDQTQNLQLTAQLPQTVKAATLLGLTQASNSISATTGVSIQGSGITDSGGFSPGSPYTLGYSGSQITCYVPLLSAVLIQIT
jgi:hypothetical protein